MHLKETYIWHNKFKIIGLVLFVYILSRLNPDDLISYLKNVSLKYYLIAFFISVPTIFLKSLRWRLLIPGNKKVSIIQAWKYYWIAVFWGAVTPGKVGELFKIRYLNQMGYSTGESTAATVMDRFFDMILLLLLVYIGMIFYSSGFSDDVFFFSILLISGASLFLIIYLFRKRAYKIFLKAVEKFLPGSVTEKFHVEAGNVIKTVKAYNFKKWLYSILLTLLTWTFFILQRYIVSMSLGLDIDVFYFSNTVLLAALITLIPVSVQGIGTRDAVFIYMFGFVGIDSTQAVTLSALILMIMFFNTFIGYILYLAISRKDKSDLVER